MKFRLCRIVRLAVAQTFSLCRCTQAPRHRSKITIQLRRTSDLIDRESAEAKKQRLDGHFHESILIYNRVLRQTNRPAEEYRHCRALLGIAMSEMWLFQFSNAFEHFDMARKSATLRADHMQLAWATLDLSTLDLILNDPSTAAIHAEEANSQFLLSLSKEGVARALINRGTAWSAPQN